jgi:hypothetical protein
VPPCHRATVPPYHRATVPPCHRATVPPVPPYHRATVPPCHRATVPSCHRATLARSCRHLKQMALVVLGDCFRPCKGSRCAWRLLPTKCTCRRLTWRFKIRAVTTLPAGGRRMMPRRPLVGLHRSTASPCRSQATCARPSTDTAHQRQQPLPGQVRG